MMIKLYYPDTRQKQTEKRTQTTQKLTEIYYDLLKIALGQLINPEQLTFFLFRYIS